MQPPTLPSRLTEQGVPASLAVAYRKLSDLALVARARAGDGPALDVLVERYAPRVNRIAAHVLGDFEDARDAAQESLVKLCTRLRQFRGEAQFATWLHRLVVNTCRDVQARKEARPSEPLELDEERAGGEWDPAALTLLADLRTDVARALGCLSPDQRVVVVLRDAFGLSYEEIARVASMPVGTAKCYVHRGRERLRLDLEETMAAEERAAV